MGMCGPNGIAAQFFGSFMSGLTFFAQFLGYSVGNNWMPHPYMKQRPKIWKIRLKILVYTGAGMAGIGGKPRLGGMPRSSGRHADACLLQHSAA